MKRLIISILFLGILGYPSILLAQFYNGHQMNFGKNRIQYNDFYWSYYHFDKFDVYFNQNGKEIAAFTGEKARDEILILEERLNHKLNRQLIFLVYNKFTDFKQSNVGLVTGKEESNTGGVTQIRNNKVSLYFQGSHQEYLKQMKTAIAEVIVMEMLYGNKLSDNFANSTMLNLPEWYSKGLISFLSENWSTNVETKVRDGILNNRYTKFNRLTGEDAIYAGHSFWKYIHDYYGSTVITDLLYLTRVNKGANSAIMNVLGIQFKEVTKQWLSYYQSYFKDNINNSNTTSQGNPLLSKQKAIVYYSQAKASPIGDKIAYVSNNTGQHTVWIYDSQTEKPKKILKQGHKLKQINDFSYPVLAWHPSGKFLTMITEKEGGLKLILYGLEEDRISERELLYFDKILDFSYSDDGSKMVFSAVKESKTDIYVFDIASSTHQQITNDIADDFNPKFISNSSQIVFSSNRLNDSLNTNYNTYNKQFDLFVYDYGNKSSILRRITTSSKENELSAFEYKQDEFYYLNDKNGIHNLFYGKYDSTISFIDTAIHYRYFLNQIPLTNLQGNIYQHHLNRNKNTYTYTHYKNGNYLIFKKAVESNPTEKIQLQKTKFKRIQDSIKNQDESIGLSLKRKSIPDSSEIFSKENNYVDINHYIFEKEKPYFNYKYENTGIDTTSMSLSFPKVKIYQRTFYTNHVVSQVDFGFLSSTYQPFTGGAVYFNPGVNALFKIGAYDLLEDYKIVAGVRFSADFNSNEYLVSLENLKKRIDEQVVYHRQSFKNTTEDFVTKSQTNKLMYIRTIPFSEVNGLKGTATLRHDRQIFLSINRQSLQNPDIHKAWAGAKLEYIFDNTISKGVNLYNGTRYKIFGEYYNRIYKTKTDSLEKTYTDLFVVGADFRHYQKIHRDLILAVRFAASTSLGKSKLIYYLGGVDNWTNLSQTTPTFIPLKEIPIKENEEYAYQAVATNLRGFPQNIRNGNSFALINTELRFPFIKYFSNYPINSSFWQNLQLVGFFDAGTAWSGLSPYSKENAYDKDVIERESLTITLDTERDPIVAGYGMGLRVMLFGYFARFDWAWGIENQEITPRVFYFSLSLDF